MGSVGPIEIRSTTLLPWEWEKTLE